MAIHHTVVFRLVHETGSAEAAEFLRTARATLSAIPGVTEFLLQAQVSPKSNLDWQFSMRFADQATCEGYNNHADHVRFVSTRWESESPSTGTVTVMRCSSDSRARGRRS